MVQRPPCQKIARIPVKEAVNLYNVALLIVNDAYRNIALLLIFSFHAFANYPNLHELLNRK